MSTVGTSSFLEDGQQSYFTLHNEQYLRKLDYNYSWTELQIGVLYAIEATASVTGGLWIGLGSSTQGNVGLKNGGASLKRMLGGGTGAIWVIIGGNPVYQNLTYIPDPPSGSCFPVPILVSLAYSGSALVGSSGSPPASTANAASTEFPARKTVFMVKFGRQPTYINAIAYSPQSYTSSAKTNKNHTDSILMSSLYHNGPACDGVSMAQVGAATMTNNAHDDSNYPLDMVNIFWTGSCPVRIYDIKVNVGS